MTSSAGTYVCFQSEYGVEAEQSEKIGRRLFRELGDDSLGTDNDTDTQQAASAAPNVTQQPVQDDAL